MTAKEAGRPWRGVIEEYREFLPVGESTPVVTLHEGATPLLPAPRLSARKRPPACRMLRRFYLAPEKIAEKPAGFQLRAKCTIASAKPAAAT